MYLRLQVVHSCTLVEGWCHTQSDLQSGHHLIEKVKKKGLFYINFKSDENVITQKTWSGLSPMRNPVHLRLWGLTFLYYRRCGKLGLQRPSSIGLW